MDRSLPPPTARDALQAQLDALAARRPAPATSARAGAGGAPLDPRRGPSRPRRRHAAKGARASALGLSLTSTGALAALFAVTGSAAGREVEPASIVSTPASTVDAASTTAATSAETTVPAAAAPPAATTLVDGGVYHNKWGDVQVQVAFGADGTIVDILALQTPDEDHKSVRINERAVPQLISEALTIQSADVDTVSGATYTSTDYRRSLQSAIDLARSAGITSLA